MIDSYAGLVGNILIIVKNLTALGAGIALFLFIWGIIKYVGSGDNASQRSDSTKTITYGLIALFVLITVWSLVGLLQESLLDGGRNLNIPQLYQSGNRGR